MHHNTPPSPLFRYNNTAPSLQKYLHVNGSRHNIDTHLRAQKTSLSKIEDVSQVYIHTHTIQQYRTILFSSSTKCSTPKFQPRSRYNRLESLSLSVILSSLTRESTHWTRARGTIGPKWATAPPRHTQHREREENQSRARALNIKIISFCVSERARSPRVTCAVISLILNLRLIELHCRRARARAQYREPFSRRCRWIEPGRGREVGGCLFLIKGRGGGRLIKSRRFWI